MERDGRAPGNATNPPAREGCPELYNRGSAKVFRRKITPLTVLEALGRHVGRGHLFIVTAERLPVPQTHLKTKVPPAPWPSTSLGLKETFPTTTTSGSTSAEKCRHPAAFQHYSSVKDIGSVPTCRHCRLLAHCPIHQLRGGTGIRTWLQPRCTSPASCWLFGCCRDALTGTAMWEQHLLLLLLQELNLLLQLLLLHLVLLLQLLKHKGGILSAAASTHVLSIPVAPRSVRRYSSIPRTMTRSSRTPPPSSAVPTAASIRSQSPESGYTSVCSLWPGSGGMCPSLPRRASSSTLLGARNCRRVDTGLQQHPRLLLLPAIPKAETHRPPLTPCTETPCNLCTSKGLRCPQHSSDTQCFATHIIKHSPGRRAAGNDGFCCLPQVLRESSEHGGVHHGRQLMVPWGGGKQS